MSSPTHSVQSRAPSLLSAKKSSTGTPGELNTPARSKRSTPKSSGKKPKLPKCTACSNKRDAETLHPVLRVPICGACSLSFKQRDTSIIGSNESSCVWCGRGDDNELMMCDDCPFSFCSQCITHNFGFNETNKVREKDYWSCYVCSTSSKLANVQVEENTTFYSLDNAYAMIKPPADFLAENIDRECIALLSLGEARFASYFCDEIQNGISIQVSNILSYLTAQDILPKVYCLSKGLRRFFKSRVFCIPGLFQTSFGQENHCQLHMHQEVSLHAMKLIEEHGVGGRKGEGNSSASGYTFGSLRGGIFADEPGLGKTVTALALIASTAGTMPLQPPQVFWTDQGILEENWRYSEQEQMLQHIYQRLWKTGFVNIEDPAFLGIRNRIRDKNYWMTLQELHTALKDAIRKVVPTQRLRERARAIIQYEMSALKAGLDKRRQSTLSGRLRYERKLYPSSATLIIVPLALLEHWYEQILRHLNLLYFSYLDEKDDDSEEDGDDKKDVEGESTADGQQQQSRYHRNISCRGVVYLDGLGDIVDVEAPLSKLLVNGNKPIETATILSSYLIVVTTLERCALENKVSSSILSQSSHVHGSSAEMRSSQQHATLVAGSESLASESPLLSIRWLRLIIDEGHEIGRLRNDPSVSKAFMQASDLICHIAAERRWIMSGTPTTGAHSEVGLYQLFRLLSFLRHPKYTTTGSMDTWRKNIVLPCLQQNEDAWEEVNSLLKEMMVRHTKSDINLFDPIESTCNLEGISLPEDQHSIDNPYTLRVDRARATHIAQTILQAKREYLETIRHNNAGYASLLLNRSSTSSSSSSASSSSSSASASAVAVDDQATRLQLSSSSSPASISSKKTTLRRPKAIVFSQHPNDLQGVGHFLYMMLGDAAMCEHNKGSYQSAELSRFRHSKRKTRQCPLCGHENSITNEDCCEKVLYLVEYIDQQNPFLATATAATPAATTDGAGAAVAAAPAGIPYPGGHGEVGEGGHYLGHCLCSPQGCPTTCYGYPNALQPQAFGGMGIQQMNNLALIGEEHIQNHFLGGMPALGQQVYVIPGKAIKNADILLPMDPTMKPPILWYGGRKGGPAIVRQWRRCGGKDFIRSWHGHRILPSIPWNVQEEDTLIMLLQQEGSTGLDLSFATHIFLLERIQDPALKNQIVSRAHRVGAKGPVQVQLLQVVAHEEEEDDDGDNDKVIEDAKGDEGNVEESGEKKRKRIMNKRVMIKTVKK